MKPLRRVMIEKAGLKACTTPTGKAGLKACSAPAVVQTFRSAAIAVALVTIVQPTPAEAHRVDELLQTTRIAITGSSIDVELDLTPGAAVAADVFASIDTDGDGRIDATEGTANAAAVLRALTLSVDERAAALSIVSGQYPDYADMAGGVGTIRLRATAALSASEGDHRLKYTNGHRPDASVYLVNALVPADRDIEISAQQRDAGQRSITLHYRVGSPLAAAMRWVPVVLGMISIVGARRFRKSGRT